MHASRAFHGTWNDTKCDQEKPYICKYSTGTALFCSRLVSSSTPFRNIMINCVTHMKSRVKQVVDDVTYIVRQRNRQQLLPLVMGSVCRSGPTTVATVTSSTTVNRASLGRTPATTASNSKQIWCLSTAERMWSLSGILTPPKITTSGLASPGTATVSVEMDRRTMTLMF